MLNFFYFIPHIIYNYSLDEAPFSCPPRWTHALSTPPPCTSLNIKTSFSTFHKGSYVYGPDADWHVGVEILTLIPQVAEHLDQVENLH